MAGFIVSIFATVANWLALNVWLVVYWILIPLAVACAADFIVKHLPHSAGSRIVIDAGVFVLVALGVMVYSGEFGFIF